MIELITGLIYSSIGFALGWFAGRQARQVEQIHSAVVQNSDDSGLRQLELGIVVTVIAALVILVLLVNVVGCD